jgi:hypothetical protein
MSSPLKINFTSAHIQKEKIGEKMQVPPLLQDSKFKINGSVSHPEIITY